MPAVPAVVQQQRQGGGVVSVLWFPAAAARELLRGVGIGFELCWPRRWPRCANSDSGGGAAASAADSTKLFTAAAIQLREWADHPDCLSPHYCRSLARRLDAAAQQPE
ncbi:hypothetical protein ACT16_06765 [Mycobacterium heckeshornense]|nr:hypothetical protein ACT16_06765 [Mycobacterium heckeshornense]